MLQTVAPLGTASPEPSSPEAPQVEALARPRLQTKRLGDESGGFRGGRADHCQVRFDAQWPAPFLGGVPTTANAFWAPRRPASTDR